MQSNERRPDIDIEADIDSLTRSFAPLKASRGYFAIKSTNGIVTVMGNVRNPQARRVLLDNLPRVRGVKDCDASELYDDEMIRFAVGQLLPPGVTAGVHYGAVVLNGHLPVGTSPDAIIAAVSAIKGVRRVVADFAPNTNVDKTPIQQKIEPAE